MKGGIKMRYITLFVIIHIVCFKPYALASQDPQKPPPLTIENSNFSSSKKKGNESAKSSPGTTAAANDPALQSDTQIMLEKNEKDILEAIESGDILKRTGWKKDLLSPTGEIITQKKYWDLVREAYNARDIQTFNWLSSKSISPARTTLLLVKLIDDQFE